MTSPRGFGPPKEEQQKKPSKRAKERERAAQQFDKMKSQGGLEYEVYVRIVGKPNWVPMGAITVKQSRFISRAIYSNEKPLLEAAFRVAPLLKRYEGKLEYGYRLKAEKKAPIELALKPGGLGGLGKGLSKTLSQGLGGLFKKKESE
jgi:hypothetical protein